LLGRRVDPPPGPDASLPLAELRVDALECQKFVKNMDLRKLEERLRRLILKELTLLTVLYIYSPEYLASLFANPVH
jgi:hypothetical protein